MDDNLVPVPSVFLSHASEDKADFAEPLGRELASLGVRPWLDKWEIRPGDSLVTKLFDEGVAAVDAVIVIVSQHSAGKRWVRAELDAAMVRKITEDTRLIPIRLDEADMPAPLKTLVWHNAARTEDRIRDAARVVADTLHERDTRPVVAPPPAYASTVRVPGLTAADSTLLTLLAEEAISANTLLCIPWPEVVARTASRGLDEGLDRLDGCLNLSSVGHVQGQRRDALIRVGQGLARTPVHPLRASPQGFLDQRLPDATICPGHRNCLAFDGHSIP